MLGTNGAVWSVQALCWVLVSQCFLWRRVNLFDGKADHLLFIYHKEGCLFIGLPACLRINVTGVGQWSNGCWGLGMHRCWNVHTLHDQCRVTACLDLCCLLSDGKLGY